MLLLQYEGYIQLYQSAFLGWEVHGILDTAIAMGQGRKVYTREIAEPEMQWSTHGPN